MMELYYLMSLLFSNQIAILLIPIILVVIFLNMIHANIEDWNYKSYLVVRKMQDGLVVYTIRLFLFQNVESVMQNKDHSIPQSQVSKHHIFINNFPIERPIFWGPGQFTEYPDTYNEPSGFRNNDILGLPKVARFFFGGNEAALKEQFIHLGYTNYAYVYSGLQRPCVPFPDIFQYQYYGDVITDVEIADPPYNASKATLELLDEFMIIEAHSKLGDPGGELPWSSGIFNKTFQSRVDSQLFCGTTAYNFITGAYGIPGIAMPSPDTFVTTLPAVWPSTLTKYAFDPPPPSDPYWINRLRRTVQIWLYCTKLGSVQTYKLINVFTNIGWNQPPSSTPSPGGLLISTDLTMDFP